MMPGNAGRVLAGKTRQSASSHRIYKTPWQGDPRINIQNHKGKAKGCIYKSTSIINNIF